MNKNTVVTMRLKDGHDFDWKNIKIGDPEKITKSVDCMRFVRLTVMKIR